MSHELYQKYSILNYKKKVTTELPPVNIESELLNTFFFLLENDFELKSIIMKFTNTY